MNSLQWPIINGRYSGKILQRLVTIDPYRDEGEVEVDGEEAARVCAVDRRFLLVRRVVALAGRRARLGVVLDGVAAARKSKDVCGSPLSWVFLNTLLFE